jgi:hypothetical protein
MRLVVRRARAAYGLLLAATGATLVATLLLTGVAGYGRQVVDAGARSLVGTAPADERSVLLRGPSGSPADLAARDRAVRSRFAGGFGGLDVRISGAGYAAGRQLTGDLGDAVPDKDGAVFASVVFLDGLPGHADLVSGRWPAGPRQGVLAEAVATTLHATVGGRLRIVDRFTGKPTEIAVAGIWRPRDLTDPYWRLVPDVATGVAPGSATYGPIVLSRDDFLRGFAAYASAGWVVEPDLAGVDAARLGPLRRTVADLPKLSDQVGFGSGGQVTTRLDRLIDRLDRADLVGRSALVTPMLLVAVLGGYALLLVAILLTEHRRGETALLRARGAARYQLAGLAAREAALVVLPVAVVAPPLATGLLRYADRVPYLSGVGLDPVSRLDLLTWLVAALAGAGCAAAMVGPAVRHTGSHVAELASRSRPNRWALAQRVGLDLALVVLAVLGWLQLRQYSSPLAGASALGIDPLLAAAPTLGVLAGAVLALRLLPPLTGLAERLMDRRPWTTAVLGMWQAGRRPHAGPVLLLALAVGVSTLAWCLAGTSERSALDQARHRVGADVRLVEQSISVPPDRAAELARLPGVATALPAWRGDLEVGAEHEPTSMVALDAAAAPAVVRLRPDLAGGSPDRVFSALAAGRVTAPTIQMSQRRLTGEVTTSAPATTTAVFATPDGYREVPLGTSTGSRSLRFSVDAGARLAGFLVDAGPPGARVFWQLRSPVNFTAAEWQAHDQSGAPVDAAVDEAGLSVGFTTGGIVGVAPTMRPGPVPVVATPQALSALRMRVGDQTRLALDGPEVDVRMVGTVKAVPGDTGPSALLVDLPSLSAILFNQYGTVRAPQEWWLSSKPGERVAVTGLSGVDVIDRRTAVDEARRDPYGVGSRGALFGTALGAVLLAAMGIAVDVRATARRRAGELAVLHTLGAGVRMLARSLVAEQAFLAGIGVLVGLCVGVAVAAAMAPLVILTPAAERPVPAPVLEVAWWPALATAAGLFLLAVVLSALGGRTVRRGQIGELA